MAIRALIVEDDSFMRAMLTTTLEAKGFQILAAVGTASAAVAASERQSFDVALLDLHLGVGPTGIDVAQALRRKNPSVGLVFLTSFDDPRLLASNLPDVPGNSFYLTKTALADVTELAKSLMAAAHGLPSSRGTGSSGVLGKFTDVQLETLRLVAQGLSNAEIAKRRFVTERSIEISIARVAKALSLSPDSTKNQRVHMAQVFFRALGRSPVDIE